MPASYKIDKERRIIFSSAEGTLTEEDLREHQRSVLADPDFEPTLAQLWDFRAVEELDVPNAAVGDLARSRSYAAGTKRAFVAPRDVQYGLARMFQMLHEAAAEDIQIFRDIEEAKDWLGLA
jgi:hypothetical protein